MREIKITVSEGEKLTPNIQFEYSIATNERRVQDIAAYILFLQLLSKECWTEVERLWEESEKHG